MPADPIETLSAAPLIVLFTDFGLPYCGQMRAAVRREAPGADVIELFTNAPTRDPMAAAYLLPAYAAEFPSDTVFLCVVDPGVGSARAPGLLRADGRWYVGPDNGLFEMILRRAKEAPRWREITWRPEALSATFHGRDLFAPVAARIARGDPPQEMSRDAEYSRRPDWPDDMSRIIYIDGFGNAMTGIRAFRMPAGSEIEFGGRRIARAGTFSDVPPGSVFWYENANGLVEIAVNRGHAGAALGLDVGSEITVAPPI